MHAWHYVCVKAKICFCFLHSNLLWRKSCWNLGIFQEHKTEKTIDFFPSDRCDQKLRDQGRDTFLLSLNAQVLSLNRIQKNRPTVFDLQKTEVQHLLLLVQTTHCRKYLIFDVIFKHSYKNCPGLTCGINIVKPRFLYKAVDLWSYIMPIDRYSHTPVFRVQNAWTTRIDKTFDHLIAVIPNTWQYIMILNKLGECIAPSYSPRATGIPVTSKPSIYAVLVGYL